VKFPIGTSEANFTVATRETRLPNEIGFSFISSGCQKMKRYKELKHGFG